MSRLKTWWAEPDQFDWISRLLRQRGLLGSTRRIMALVASCSGLAAVTVLAQPQHFSPWALMVGATGGVFCVGMT